MVQGIMHRDLVATRLVISTALLLLPGLVGCGTSGLVEDVSAAPAVAKSRAED
jgi:hypothetical protein